MRILLALIFFSVCAHAQTATCWPQNSNLKNHHEYFCAVDAPPGSVITGRQLMVALADLEPVPGYAVANAGGDQNRGGIRRRFQRVEEYGLPIVSGLAGGDIIKINEPWLRAVTVLLPWIVPQLRAWVGAATPPEWEAPAILAPDGDIPLDSHGQASVTLYVRREGGVMRVPIVTPVTMNPAGLAPEPRAPEGYPKPSTREGCGVQEFHPASWYALYQQARGETQDNQWLRQYDLAWREVDREMGADPTEVYLAEGR